MYWETVRFLLFLSDKKEYFKAPMGNQHKVRNVTSSTVFGHRKQPSIENWQIVF